MVDHSCYCALRSRFLHLNQIFMKHLHGLGQLLTVQLPEFLHEPLDHMSVRFRFLPFNEQSLAALYMAAVNSEEMWITNVL